MSLRLSRLSLTILMWALTPLLWAEPHTLLDCLNEALQKNPRILQSQQSVIQSEGAIISAKAAAYPTVNGNSQLQLSNNDFFRQQNSSQTGFNDNWNVNIVVSKTLYNGGITRNQIAVAKFQKDISGYQLQQSINQTIYDTRKAFYDVLVSQSDIALRKQTIDLLTREVERQKSLFEAGRATKFNIIRTEVRLANELPGLEQATVDYQTAIYNLMNAMGYSAPPAGHPLDFQVVGGLDIVPYSSDLDQLVAEARSHSPDLAQDEKQIEIQQRNLAIAKATYIPQVSAFVGSQLQSDDSQTSAFTGNRTTSAIGLAGTWNIFDGFTGKGNAIQAQSQIRQAVIQREAIGRQIEFDVRKALLNLKEAENSYRTQQANVIKATQSIDLARSSVEAGFGTQFDILQATVDLSSAQNIELRSRYQYNVALADLERLIYRRVHGTSGDLSDLTPAGLPAVVAPLSSPSSGPPAPPMPPNP